MDNLLMKYKSFILIFCVILSSALCYFFGTYFNTIWPLTWLAPLPILLFGLLINNRIKVFLMAFLARLLGGLNFLYYWKTPIPVKIFVPGKIVESFCFAIIIIFACYAVKQIKQWYALFVFPCAIVAYEFIVSHFSPSGTISSLAYSQMRDLLILQIVSITGIWGISFLLSLFSSALVTAWYLRKNRGQAILSIIVSMGIIFVVAIFGYFKLHDDDSTAQVRVGLVAVPQTKKELLSNKQEVMLNVATRFLAAIPKLKSQGATIILLPEKIVTVSTDQNNLVIKKFQEAAKQYHVTLIVGVNEILPYVKENAAIVISPEGVIQTQYAKQHLLMTFEHDYKQGNQLITLRIHNKLAGLAICKDMDYIFPALGYSQIGAGVLFVPALDFNIDDWLHASPAIMRGVEGGYSVVRAAQWGLLSVTDRNGQIIASKKTSPNEITTLVANVPIYSGRTFYSKYTDWLVWGCIFGLLFSLYFTLVKRN